MPRRVGSMGLHWLGVLWLALAAPASAAGGEPQIVPVAVATNFLPVARQLAPLFEARTGYQLTLMAGSSGKLYAQIRQGAPYDVLLSADQDKPARLEALGLTVAGQRFVYATGRLVIWAGPGRVVDGPQRLRQEQPLALANPRLAPYGQAAIQVLEHLGLSADASRWVLGDSVGQAAGFVATGHARLGLVAWSLVPATQRDQVWHVPAAWHDPIHQEAVLLARGASKPAARAFFRWLQGNEAQAQIVAAGYAVDLAQALH